MYVRMYDTSTKCSYVYVYSYTDICRKCILNVKRYANSVVRERGKLYKVR